MQAYVRYDNFVQEAYSQLGWTNVITVIKKNMRHDLKDKYTGVKRRELSIVGNGAKGQK